MKKQLQLIAAFCLMCMLVLGSSNTSVFAISDGAYTVSVTYSYQNPETNQTEDGASNVALGESMIKSMLEQTALVEQVNGKTYVTIGLGLMSNVSSVRIQTQTAKGGSYKEASIIKTGSSTKNGDTCNHYRFQITSQEGYISPILFIDPMGREVQFYVKLNMGTASAGTGIYKSEMIPAATEIPVATANPVETPAVTPIPEATVAPTAQSGVEATKAPTISTEAPTVQPETTVIPVEDTEEELEETTIEEADEESEEAAAEMQPASSEEVTEQKESSMSMVSIIAIIVIVVSAMGTGLLLLKVKKGERHE